MSGTILWDVDTQVDFIEPGAKLYFPGAEEARSAMARLVEKARDAAVRALLRRGRRITFVEDASRGVEGNGWQLARERGATPASASRQPRRRPRHSAKGWAPCCR